VYYWASPLEAGLCSSEEVILVGGGNSAGQAAVYLSAHAAKVHMLIRKDSLASTMSSYLIERIAATPNIELHVESEIVALEGSDEEGLQQVRVRDNRSRLETDYDICRVFLFIGADPNTGWLSDCGVQVDDKGFILTGYDAPGGEDAPRWRPACRACLPSATCAPTPPSGWRRRSAKARPWYRRSTASWHGAARRRPGAAGWTGAALCRDGKRRVADCTFHTRSYESLTSTSAQGLSSRPGAPSLPSLTCR
jgi:hypothetical protein